MSHSTQSAFAHAHTPTTFNFGAQAVRVVMRDGEPWFVATDVCRALGIANHRDALAKLDADEKGVGSADTLGGLQQLAIVSESGLYTLILRCRDAVKPGTVPHRFRRWVTGEVLPAIRRTGAYTQRGVTTTPAAAANVAVAWVLATEAAREVSFAVFEAILAGRARGDVGRPVWSVSLVSDPDDKPRAHARQFDPDELTVRTSSMARELRQGELSAHFSDEALSDVAAACLDVLARRLRAARSSKNSTRAIAC